MEATQSILPTRSSLLMTPAPPADPGERERIGREVWIGLCLRYEQIASKTDVELLRRGSKSDKNYALVLRRFDEFVLDQFTEWGWRLLLSCEILLILARWEADSPELCEKLGLALSNKARIWRGEKAAPFLAGIEQFADEAITELKSLLRMQRDEFRQRVGPRPNCERIAAWMKIQIESRPDDFPRLRDHLEQLHGFIANYLPANNRKAARMLETGEIRADSLFYQWLAVSTNRSIKDVRNKLSDRRRIARRGA